MSSRDTFRLKFLVTVAVAYTLPWDSYIIKNKSIDRRSYGSSCSWGPSLGFLAVSTTAFSFTCQPGHQLFYLSATGFWASPICGGLWALGGDHVIRRPYSIMISIIIPTLYLSFTDTIAIRNGTWFISPITSTGIFVAPHLPLEEFTFFAITNVLLVLGLATIEKFDAIAGHLARVISGQIGKFTPATSGRIHQLNRTLEVLSVAVKAFTLLVSIFPNFCAIRSKFVILYGFCRETDDPIDNAIDKQEARAVNVIPDSLNEAEFQAKLEEFVSTKVPEKSRPTFLIFSTMRKILRREPFDELISGYEYDSIEFLNKEIKTEDDLDAIF
ncbi:hypothetical protein Pst134EA_011843 [Puccinia striiformis f. sp. tritici]|uniref:hypothetical protein n=1 Tax=Puccinia striiformis f. sp. tritici TaxID=168172 RepID=UPI002007C600|nr:hypothetical protein Pst134EA_011843 [Puccinia striiformis f. sp. tritici]KAH9468214.1 hypothetical protein Pst134EA_011843 [Puccinia striiformis f. sp. tritici]